MAVLAKISNADLGYGAPIIPQFSIEIKSGDLIAMVGPNGSGKSTILKSILGIIPLLSGTREVLGLKDPKPHQLAGKISYVPQKVEINKSIPITVSEFFKLKTSTISQKEIRQALATVQLENFEHRSLHKLSGGEFQRVMLAFSVLGKPSLIFLDEVSEGMDLKSQNAFLHLVQNLMKRHEMAVMMISHDISAVSATANRVICINRELLFDGSPHSGEFHSCLHKIYGEESLIHGHNHH